MCCSSAPAHFENTIVYIGVKYHPVHGLIHVLSYQNQAQSFGGQPNAMILHLPNAERMGQGNFIDTGDCKHFLRDMVRTLFPPRIARGLGDRSSMLIGSAASHVEVFEHGSYHVVLSDRPSLIPEALEQVPLEKRPSISPELFNFYQREFPDWTLALCCFNDKVKAEPMTLWYPPRFEGRVMWPALDSHTGGPPDIRANVAVDHVIIAGADDIEPDDRFDGGARKMPDLRDCGPWANEFLPKMIVGAKFHGQLPNGDFVLDLEDLMAGKVGSIDRLPVPSLVGVN